MGRKPREDEVITIMEAAAEEAKKEEFEDTNIVIPDRNSPDWSDYILSQFTDAEVMIKKNDSGKELARYPKVNGLRRLSGKYIGEIIESKPLVVNNIINLPDGWVASTYIYEVTFKNNDTLKKFADVGEVLFGDKLGLSNIPKSFAKFPSAVAVTRGEARALRKALGLNVIAWEEFDAESEKSKESEINLIKDIQKAALITMSKRLKIDLNKYINSGNYAYTNINEIEFSDAAKMWQQLDSFQRDHKALSKHIEICQCGLDAATAATPA